MAKKKIPTPDEYFSEKKRVPSPEEFFSVKKKDDSEISSSDSPEVEQPSTSTSDNKLIQESEGYTPPEISIQEEAKSEQALPEQPIVEDTKLKEDIDTASQEMIDESQKRYEESLPLYHKALTGARESISSQRADLDRRYPNPTKITQTGDPEYPLIETNRQYAAERDQLNLAEKYIDEVESILSAEKGRAGISAAKLRGKNFEDLVTLGWSKVLDAGQLKKTAQKALDGESLSEQEQILLAFYGFKEDVKNNVEVPISYDVIGGMIDMIPYMANIATTGGIGSGASKITGKFIKETSKKSISKYAAKGTNYLLGKSVQALAMPMTYEGTLERQVGGVTYDEKGELKVIKGDDPATAFLKSYGSTIAEIGVEGFMDDVVRAGKLTNSKGLSSLIRRETKFGGFTEELTEEFVTAVIQAPIEGQTLEETFTPRMVATTILTVGGMSGAMTALDYATGKSDGKDVAKNKSNMEALGDMLSTQTKKKVDDVVDKEEDVKEAGRKIEQIVDEGRKDKEWNGEDISTVIQYASSRNKDNSFNKELSKEQIKETGALEQEKVDKTLDIQKEEKVSKTEPETPKTEVKEPKVEPKVKEDEKVVQDEVEVSKDVGKEIAKEKEEVSKRKEKVVPEDITLSEKVPISKGMKRILKAGDNAVTREIQEKGERVGEITLEEGDATWNVKRVDVDDTAQGRGIAKNTYINLNEQAKKEGKVLRSDRADKINDKSKPVWESLVKSGDAIKLDDGSYTFKKEGDAKEIESREMRVEGKAQEGESISDKDMPEIDRAIVQNREKIQKQVEQKVGKIEELEAKKKKAVQSGLDRLSRLGGTSFALDEGGKKQAIEDMAMAAVDFANAGVISMEIGGIKAVDYVRDQLKSINPKSEQFINENREAIQKIFDAEVEKVLKKEKAPKTEPKQPKTKVETEPKTKERKLGRKALDSTDLPDDFKDALAKEGVVYSVRGKKVTEKEASDIAKVYIENGRIDELKSVILDVNNEIAGDTRTTMAVSFANEALNKSEQATNKADKAAYMADALDVFYMDMKQSTTQAQALQSKVKWSEIVSRSPDLFVEYAKKEQRKNNDPRLESRKEDIKTAKEVIEDFLKSEAFEKVSEEKAKEKYDKLVNKGKESRVRKERGKAKLASGINTIVEAIGAKKNAVSENEVSPDILNGLKEMADGILDIGVSSVDQMMTQIKVALREYLSPTEIDKYKNDIVKETKANGRLKTAPRKSTILTPKELNQLVDRLYSKMANATKAEARRLAKEYIDRLNDGGALDERSFKDIFAKSVGLEVLDAKNEAKLREMATKLSDLRAIKNNLESLFKKFTGLDAQLAEMKKRGVDTGDFTDQYNEARNEIDTQIKEYNKALEVAKQANKDVSDFFADPRTTADLLSTFIQGNLLTPISLITNVTANTAWLPFRGVKYSIANLLDMGLYGMGAVKESLAKKYKDNKRISILLSKLPDKKRTYDLMGYARGYIPGFKEGTIEGLKQLITGQLPEDAYIREMGRSLKPIEALAKNIAALKGEERLKAVDAFNNMVEGIFGIPPEIMFRILNLGDKPYRRAAERARLNEIAELKGLKGVAKEAFLKFPDNETLEEMRKAGLEATYQQDNVLSDFILHGAKKKGNKTEFSKKSIENIDRALRATGRLLVKTQIPYVKTPTNIVMETIDYAMPSVSIMRGMYHLYKGDRRKGLDYISRGIVGFMLDSAITSLITSGIFTLAPQGLEEDDDYKARIRESEYRNKLPYYFNSDSFKRMMSGEDTTFQEGDNLYSYKRFGIVSSLLMAKAESFRGKTIDEISEMTMLERRSSMFFPIVKSSFDQSFLAGVSNFMSAFDKGGYALDQVYVNTARALEASAIPNTYTAVNKYYDGYIRETKDKTLKSISRTKKEIANDFKASYTTDSGLPTKVTVWGEPVTRVPDGKGLGYILFDVTKHQEYGSNFGVKLHELYERTGDDKVLPTQPPKTYSFNGTRVRLTPKMYEDLQTKIGVARRQEVEPLVSSDIWDDMTDEEKLFELNIAYKVFSRQKSMVKDMFEDEWYNELEEMAEKATK